MEYCGHRVYEWTPAILENRIYLMRELFEKWCDDGTVEVDEDADPSGALRRERRAAPFLTLPSAEAIRRSLLCESRCRLQHSMIQRRKHAFRSVAIMVGRMAHSHVLLQCDIL